MTINNIIAKFFEVRDQIHYWHLQTKSYSEHKALNKFYEEWIDLADRFIETFQGRYEQVSGEINISLKTYMLAKNLDSQPTATQYYLKQVLIFLQGDARKVLYAIDTDLNNILDEMQGLVSRTIYMLNLK